MGFFTEGTSITATLARQWEYMADGLIRANYSHSDDQISSLIKAQNGCRDAAWVRARRQLHKSLAKSEAEVRRVRRIESQARALAWILRGKGSEHEAARAADRRPEDSEHV